MLRCLDVSDLENHVGEFECACGTIVVNNIKRHSGSPRRRSGGAYSRVVRRTSMTIDTGCNDEFMVRRASTNVVATSSALDTTLQGMRRLASRSGSTAPVWAAYHSWSPRPPR